MNGRQNDRTTCSYLRRTGPRCAFTLVEVLIVTVIIGILASILVPRYSDSREEATKSSLMTSLDVIKGQIDLRYHTAGSWPATIDAEWFVGGKLPQHAENSFGVAEVEVVSAPGKIDPDDKVLSADAAGAFWYNAAEGIIRARVQARATESATLLFYNQVNESSATDVGEYEDPGVS